ncbi:hypothetical protein ACFV8T_13625, partial [Streptomyces sp. NPDC059832]|uniref:hypothetical protein n=1 Tax=Streptomyces sp. NPDC059832 TaxID=3346966 RepID=UPI00365FE6FA
SGLGALLEDVAVASSGLGALLEDVAVASSGLGALLEDVAVASSGLGALLEDVAVAELGRGPSADLGRGLWRGLGRCCDTCRTNPASERRDQARHADQAGNSLPNASHHGGFLACEGGFALACTSHSQVVGVTAA